MIETILVIAALFLFYSWRSACNAAPSGAYAVAEIPASPPACSARKTQVPEDAVLRRHFVSQLVSEIEAALPPRPADSVLRRHHQALVAARVQQRLAELGTPRRG